MKRETEYIEEDIVEIDLREYLELLWQRKWIIIGLLVLAIVASYLFSQQMTRIYQTSTLVMVKQDQQGSDLFSDQLSMSIMGSRSNKIATYSEMIKSRRILTKVIEKLDLKNKETGEYIKPKSLKEKISISKTGQETDLMRITVTYPDPKKAKNIANTLVSVFEEENKEINRADLQGASDFVNTQLNTIKDRLSKLENQLLQFKEDKGVLYPSQQGKNLLDRLTEVKKAKTKTEIQLKQAKASINEINKNINQAEKRIITARTFTKNPAIQNIKTRLTELELSLSSLKEVYTDKHPEVKKVEAEMAKAQKELNNLVEEIVSNRTESINPLYQDLRNKLINLQTTVISSQAQLASYQQQIDDINKDLKSLPEKELALSRLQREKQITEDIYLMLMKRQEEIQIQKSMKSSDIVVVDSAITREKPIKPNVKLNVMIAAVLGLFLGVGIVFFLEFMDTTVKEEEDVEKITGLPVLGVIPDVSNIDHSQGYGRDDE